VAVCSEAGRSDEDALQALARGAQAMARKAASALGRSLTVSAEAPPPPPPPQSAATRQWALVPLAAGVAFAAAAVGLFIASGQNYQGLVGEMPPSSADQGRALQSAGRIEQTLGAVS